MAGPSPLFSYPRKSAISAKSAEFKTGVCGASPDVPRSVSVHTAYATPSLSSRATRAPSHRQHPALDDHLAGASCRPECRFAVADRAPSAQDVTCRPLTSNPRPMNDIDVLLTE